MIDPVLLLKTVMQILDYSWVVILSAALFWCIWNRTR